MTGIDRLLRVGVVLTLAVGQTACSFSESSKSFSTSSGSISDSVSSIASSPSDSSKESTRYQNEVMDYTVAYVKSSNVDMVSFQKGLAGIAARQGVINWEQDPETYVGIGRGLKKVQLSEIAYETYKKNFADGDYEKMQDIQKGYDME
ncbi:MAG: putative lipoprotein [Methylococcales bacterium]